MLCIFVLDFVECELFILIAFVDLVVCVDCLFVLDLFCLIVCFLLVAGCLFRL